MDYKEMNQHLADLDQAMFTLEELYIENEGEVTEQTEQMEAQISVLKELLTGEGIDLLGGWLKAKEDKKKSLKAEKDYITRQMAAIDETIEFIKEKVSDILLATGQEKVKGDRGYSFTTTKSVKTEVDKELLNEWYFKDIENAMIEIGIPNWVTITLGARVSDVPEGTELPACFKVTEKPSVRFTKPRASKEA
jgi:hypothetical protein